MQKKRDPIDDLFRHELEEYEVTPAPEIREGIIQDAEKGSEKRSSWSQKIIWLGLFIFLISVIIGILFLNHEEEKIQVSESTGKNNIELKNQNKPLDKSSKLMIKDQIQSLSRNEGSPINNQLQNNSAKLNPQPGRTHEIETSIANHDQSRIIEHQESGKLIPPGSGSENLTAKQDSSAFKNSENSLIPLENNNVAETSEKESETQTKKTGPFTAVSSGDILKKADETVNYEKDKLSQHENKNTKHVEKNRSSIPGNWNICFGLYYTPEWMFNTLNGEKFANNTGVEGTFYFDRYSVRTGAGLSITTGSNEMVMQTNPYVGSYNILDSVSFNWDGNYNLLPTYYTTLKDLYDTAVNYNYYYINKRYTYLQVPLVLGYDFWSNKWLSLGVRAGATMSVLLNSRVLSGTYDPGKDKIISINDVSPDRIRLNWQAVAGISASFKLTRRFRLELEPDIRYYFNSVYESSDISRKPWSIGLRSAFLINY
jgi:hypothetical protein